MPTRNRTARSPRRHERVERPHEDKRDRLAQWRRSCRGRHQWRDVAVARHPVTKFSKFQAPVDFS
jgi:hypothetical protein